MKNTSTATQKNLTDVVTAVLLLVFCAVGAKSVGELPGASDISVVGPASFPKWVLIFLAICSVVLLIKSLFRAPVIKYWSEPQVTKKIFLFLGLVYLYLIALVSLGHWFATMENPIFYANGGFGISTFIFLLIALPYLGRRKPLEVILTASITTGALIAVFGGFFQVLLP